MYELYPVIAQLFPGCGITVHNVWDTPYVWWRSLALQAKQSQEASRGK